MSPLTGTWRKSSRSGGNGDCVEVRATERAIEIRDSKDQTGPVLRFTPTEWAAFTDASRGSGFLS